MIQQKEEAGSATKRREWLVATIRVAIGLGLISFLIARSDVESIREAFVSANAFLIVVAYLLNIGLLILSAFRWRVFLKTLQIELPTGSTLRLTLIGSFFNLFLPTGVGGDVYKAIRLRHANTTLASSFASVLLDRIAGVASLALIGLLISVFEFLRSGTNPLVVAALGISVGVVVLAYGLLVLGRDLIGRSRRSWFGLRPRLQRALDAAAAVIRDRPAIGRSLLLGLLCQTLLIAAHVVSARALHILVSPNVIILGLLVATVAASIPITVNGLGIREAVWVWSLGLYAIARTEALAYALLILGLALATSALGGVVYALARGEIGVNEESRS